MFGLFGDWRLQRSPLAPSVPLDGTDTVQGLQTLERLRAARLLPNNATGNGPPNGPRQAPQAPPSRRRRYQRYKGPYLEQLATDDLKKEPRPWAQFTGVPAGEATTFASSYTVPASLDLLCERMEENGAVYITNYLRVMLLILMLTLYLRPIAIFGAAAIAVSAGYNINKAMQQQQQQQTPPRDATAPPTALQSQSSTGAVLAVLTWLVVVYTRCMPIVFLGLLIGGGVVLTHAALRSSPSESRYRGRTTLSYTILQVLGRRQVPPGSDSRLVFKQVGQECWRAVVRRGKGLKRWAVFYMLTAWDAVRRPFVPAMRSAPLPTGWN